MKNMFIDALLLPKSYFRRITDKKGPLFAGMIFIGLADIFRLDLFQNLWNLIAGKPSVYSVPEAVVLVLSAVVIGVLDAFVFSLPLFDLFKVFKKEPHTEVNDSLIRLMKVYISGHFIIVPLNILMSCFVNISETTALSVLISIVILDMLFIIWFSAIISRGINTIYTFMPNYRLIVFSLVFIWDYIWGRVLMEGIGIWENVLSKMFS